MSQAPVIPAWQPSALRGDAGIVIVGGGLAGLFCALKLAPRPVTVITAAPLGEGASTAWAQGGIAAAVAEGDTPDAHWRDTVAAGAGLVDEAVALGMVREAPERIRDLLSYGVPFDRDLEGRLAVGQEAAHSARRIVHVRGDMAGRAILSALAEAVRRTPSITVRDHLALEDLLFDGEACRGVIARDLREPTRLLHIPSRATLLATGGIGQLYAVTTNPPQATGSGMAAAARAGALVADAEFVQFDPTAILTGADPAPLATEALRGEGAVLVTENGHRFMTGLHPDAELAPRDIVARGVYAQLMAGHRVFLDATRSIGPRFAQAFPTVYATCMAAGIDPARQPIPVAPAVHYHMGGVAVDANGRSSVPGLWAAGEVACTGAHGANRLASNSLLEAVVYAARTAEDLAALEHGATAQPVLAANPSAMSMDETTRRAIRALMAEKVGVIRTAPGLADAVRALDRFRRLHTNGTLQHMATSALLIAASAWQRRESRGAHFRSDFPQTDPQPQRRAITLTEAANLAAELADQPARTETAAA